MSKFDSVNPAGSVANLFLDKRKHQAAQLMFRQLDPCCIMNGTVTNFGYATPNFVVAGETRETCPECETTHLKLVLLQPGVKRTHLFCTTCTRCFDACYADGSSALETPCFYSFD